MCQGLEGTSFSVEGLFVSLFFSIISASCLDRSNLSPSLFILRWPLVHCSIAMLVLLGSASEVAQWEQLTEKKLQRSSFMYFRVV